MSAKIIEYLCKIETNRKRNNPIIKKMWYKIGKFLLEGGEIKWSSRSKQAAKRTYIYYKYKNNKDFTTGITPRDLGGMNKEKFNRLMGRDGLERGTLWEARVSNGKYRSKSHEKHVINKHVTPVTEGSQSVDLQEVDQGNHCENVDLTIMSNGNSDIGNTRDR